MRMAALCLAGVQYSPAIRAEEAMTIRRFDNILAGSLPVAIYDSVLLDLDEVVVAPTLGSIVPNWVLAIPKARCTNSAVWCRQHRASAVELVAKITDRLGQRAQNVIWFEHGAVARGDAIGCGVDHAHIHMLFNPPFSFSEFKQVVTAVAKALSWQEGIRNPYDVILDGESYLVAGAEREYVLARSVEIVGSQFFRRIVAALVSRGDAWDYRIHPHLANVEATLASFGHNAA